MKSSSDVKEKVVEQEPSTEVESLKLAAAAWNAFVDEHGSLVDEFSTL